MANINTRLPDTFDSDYPERLYSQRQAKEMFGGVSDMWIHRRLKDHTIPRPVNISGRNYWKRSDLENFFENLGEVQQ